MTTQQEYAIKHPMKSSDQLVIDHIAYRKYSITQTISLAVTVDAFASPPEWHASAAIQDATLKRPLFNYEQNKDQMEAITAHVYEALRNVGYISSDKTEKYGDCAATHVRRRMTEEEVKIMLENLE